MAASKPPEGNDGTDSSTLLRERRVDINGEFAEIEAFLTEYVSNISHTGAFIRTRDPWPVGSRIRLKFTILAADPEILEGTALVVRVSENPRGMGVEFVEMSEAGRTLIDRVLGRPSRTIFVVP